MRLACASSSPSVKRVSCYSSASVAWLANPRLRSVSFWVIDLPAAIVTIWYRMYVVILAVGSIVTVGTLLTVLGLWLLFGVRWGW